ncbi:TAT-translocated FGD2 family F420-dependent dehydrogenase [Motilibacter rhizosphaerae]|uniref:TAT-translocated FGD2 family F420-dependent dehydrogenase n=1 Tax=Motilibacter rhizosphaerae TaxID=598652 RepID=A0A4Q7NPC5_9ACTN|nr:LLM class flavin-dependent oxidoreductase [Motilibacter rhizosphaerae]RZS87135.1 TAT-translocated FGD2 family F420-dependent dehydrogenase [Motilibacter rhizosphaerae]
MPPTPAAAPSPAAPSPTVSRRALLAGLAAVSAVAAAPATAYAAPPKAPAGKKPVGFVLSHEQFRTQSLVAWSTQAEAAGFGYLWTSDHIQPWEDVQGHAMHPWITQALLSQSTRTATFGTGVTCPIYRHHPSEVAQAWASLGILAPGRVFLGVGAGEALNERAATGQFGPYAERAARLVEAVQLIRELWKGQRTTFTGQYYSVDQFQLYDVPTKPVPILMAASGPNSAYNAGRYGDGWIGSAKDQMDPALQAAFQKGAQDSGRDPATLLRYAELFVSTTTLPTPLHYAAERWRFTYDSWNPTLLYDPNPLSIQHKAERMFSMAQVTSTWPKGASAQVHVDAVQGLLDMGVLPFVHSGERDQPAVIDFYGEHVLPKIS